MFDARPAVATSMAILSFLVVAVAANHAQATSVEPAESDWSITPSPDVTDAAATNYLTGVTCITESDCWAVGASYVRAIPQTLIQHWDGATWSIVASPNTVATKPNVLSRVTCTSTSDCWAVGWHKPGNVQRTLTQHWDGATWSIVASPNTSEVQSNLLKDVSCASATDCWSVGNHYEGGSAQTLIMSWDGTSWSIISSPNTASTNNNFLSGVSCVSASDCWAVGSSDNEVEQGIYHALIEHWDGTSWSIVTAPIGTLLQSNHLAGVTCVSASDCWAVGWQKTTSDQQTMIVRWDGTSWSTVISPTNSLLHNHILDSVTCTSPSNCWAVGQARTGGLSVSGVQTGSVVGQTLIQHWDGTSWSIVASANTGLAQDNDLSGVTCVSGSQCWAIGYANTGGEQTLVEHWDGTAWSIVGSPNVSAGQTPNFLLGMTCPTESDCWAVGYYMTGTIRQTLIERWGGEPEKSWSISPSPNTGPTKDNFLTGVTCNSATDCWAVGYSDEGGVLRTLIERWDGTSWSIVPSPNTGATEHNFLSGVTCLSESDCWAVGSSGTSDTGNAVYQTLIEHWDGASWSIVPSANTSAAQGNAVYSVACSSASDCWAVGYYFTGRVRQTLIQRWDGESWAIVSSPNTSTTNVLTGVACVSASDCWAVGHSNTNELNETLIQRWDGSSWEVVPSPNTSPSDSNYLFGVTCASASDCWAVGYSFVGGATQTLIDRWDGTSWAIQSSPNHSSERNNLFMAVACASDADCWAAGFHHTGTAYQTLVVRNRYGTTDPTPTPTPTSSAPSEV